MENKHYQTNNFYLAAYLSAKGHVLTSVNRENPKRCLFIFRNPKKTNGDVFDFLYGESADIDARSYSVAIKELKARLYDQS